jgi:serine/threonine protein kinase
MLAQLVVVSGPDTGRSFPLVDGQTLNVGRGQESQTQLTDPRVSRKQCLIEVDGGNFILLDSGSSGGTIVNGQKVARQQLLPGDIVRIGDTELHLQMDAKPDAATLVDAVLGREPPMSAQETAPLKELVGMSLQHFEIEKVIASGNTGMVFKARDTQKNRAAAVKVLWPEASKKDEEVQRFVRAMKTMINIVHENIVQIFAAGKTGPYCWVAMEYVDGESLTKVIERIGTHGMLDWRNSLRVAVHIGRALERASEEQIIHRNITPANILVRHSDKLTKLGDLMLAKALEGALARQVTRQGQLVGDVVYMPPERTRSDATIDCRSDIYSLGATCYALLTGRPPFEGHSLTEVVAKIRRGNPPRPKQFQMSINDKFEDYVMKMLAVDPDQRYETPRQLLVDLERMARFEKVAV